MKCLIAFTDSGTGSDDKFETDLNITHIQDLKRGDSTTIYPAIMRALQEHIKAHDDVPLVNLGGGGVWAHGNAITFTFEWKDPYFGKQFMIGFVYTNIKQ